MFFAKYTPISQKKSRKFDYALRIWLLQIRKSKFKHFSVMCTKMCQTQTGHIPWHDFAATILQPDSWSNKVQIEVHKTCSSQHNFYSRVQYKFRKKLDNFDLPMMSYNKISLAKWLPRILTFFFWPNFRSWQNFPYKIRQFYTNGIRKHPKV